MLKSVSYLTKSFFIILAAFTVPVLFWIYLGIVSQMIIVHDAAGFEHLAKMFKQGDWEEYFKTGPNREPLYPYLISFAMRLADQWHVSYLEIQKLFQVLILILSLILLLFSLRKLKISTGITAAALLYFGFSPTVTNAGFSLYSEMAVFPLLLGIALTASRSWITLVAGTTGKTVLYALLFSTLFLFTTYIKGIYENIFIIFLIPFVVLTGALLRQNKTAQFRNAIVFLTVTCSVFIAGTLPMKFLNKHYNGNFTFTNRGPYALSASVNRRTQPITSTQVLSLATYNFGGEAACHKYFSPETCGLWSIERSDLLGRSALTEVQNKSPNSSTDSELLHFSQEKILNNFPQYVFLTGIEWLTMFFWESPEPGFVARPDWMDRIYFASPFKELLRVVISLLSIFSFFYLLGSLRKNTDRDKVIFLFFVGLLIFLHFTFYSLFTTVPRWAIPVIPLCLIMIANALQGLLRKACLPVAALRDPAAAVTGRDN